MTVAELKELIKHGKQHKFYISGAWKIKRLEVLRRDNFECRRCRDAGRYTKAYLVHHVQELLKVPELALDSKNLLSLCNDCHEQIHTRFGKEKVIKFFVTERW